MTEASLAYVAMGSNLDAPLKQLQTAYIRLKSLPQSKLCNISNIYKSKPQGPSGQPDYLNAVILLNTELDPVTLLQALQNIELMQGRTRETRWGARTLDLDIILYGDQVIDTPLLTIPHTEMQYRNFVLLPLFDLSPMLVIPSGESLLNLLDNVDNSGIDAAYSAEEFIKACS